MYRDPLSIDYDATVFFLHKKHKGDWDLIEKSFRLFLKFVESLGGNEATQLQHIDYFLYKPHILQHKLDYFHWKNMMEKEARIGAKEVSKRIKKEGLAQYLKQPASMALPDLSADKPADTDPETDQEAINITPSTHNILKDSLGDKLARIIKDVQQNLPSLTDDSSDSDDDDDDGDGDDDNEENDGEKDLPRLFFSGIDWSKVKLPGDEGFSWEDAMNGDEDSDKKLLERQEEKDKSLFKKTETITTTTTTTTTKTTKTKQQLAQTLLPSSLLPSQESLSHLNTQLHKLTETEQHITKQQILQGVEHGDFSLLKQAINPARPKRPSEQSFDEDGFPLNDTSSGGVCSEVRFQQFASNPLSGMEKKSEENEKTDDQKKNSARTVRPGRWTVVEHSDESDDEEDACVVSRKGYKGNKGEKGSKKGKGLKGDKSMGQPSVCVSRRGELENPVTAVP